MSEMIERAARAMCASQLYAAAWDGLAEGAQKTYCGNARAALLAALDVSDEDTVHALARQKHGDDCSWYELGYEALTRELAEAKKNIAALRAIILAGAE